MSIAPLRIPVTFGPLADPTADDTYLVARVPKTHAGKMRLTGASVVLTGAVASDVTNHVSMRLAKVGIDGLATPVNITAALGGASSAWVADAPRQFVITDTDDVNTLLSGEYVKLTYDENGTVAPGSVTGFLEFAPGV